MTEEESQDSFINALNDYYKLKSKYDDENNKNKKKIINNQSLSWKEKRAEYKKLKPKCIHCKRPGGTIFSTKYYDTNNGEEEEFRQLKAICGVTIDPCNLNITINVGKYSFFNDILKDYDSEIMEIKRNIIEYKNKLLFGYVITEDALNNFNVLKESLTNITSISQIFIEEYYEIIDNSEEKKMLKHDIEESYKLINEIKKNITEFNESENLQFVRDIAALYDTNLRPLFIKIRNLKYKENFVWYNEDTNTYHLIQNKNTIKQLEFNEGKLGVVRDSEVDQSRGQARLQKEGIGEGQGQGQEVGDKFVINPNIIANKERVRIPFEEPIINENGQVSWDAPSNKPVSLYQEAWSNNIPENVKTILTKHPDLLKNYMFNYVNAKANNEPFRTVVVQEDEPIYDKGKDRVIWNIEQYANAWESLPLKLKDVLKNDNDWMKLFMFNCVNAKVNNKPCKMTTPPGLLVPPNQKVFSNGNLDFGVPIYNEVYNKLSEADKKNYLLFVNTVDGKKVYNDELFKSKMNQLVAQEVGFDENA